MNKLNLNILHWVKFFNKGSDKDDQKEGLLKRLKNIEDKNKKWLDGIKDQEQKQPNMVSEKKKEPRNCTAERSIRLRIYKF